MDNTVQVKSTVPYDEKVTLYRKTLLKTLGLVSIFVVPSFIGRVAGILDSKSQINQSEQTKNQGEIRRLEKLLDDRGAIDLINKGILSQDIHIGAKVDGFFGGMSGFIFGAYAPIGEKEITASTENLKRRAFFQAVGQKTAQLALGATAGTLAGAAYGDFVHDKVLREKLEDAFQSSFIRNSLERGESITHENIIKEIERLKR